MDTDADSGLFAPLFEEALTQGPKASIRHRRDLPSGVDFTKVRAPQYTKAGFSKRHSVDSLDRGFSHGDNVVYALEKLGGHCPFCDIQLVEAKGNGLSFRGGKTGICWDHFIPASRWGLRTLGNFIPVCYDCNSEKSGLMPEDYWRIRKERGDKLRFATREEFDAFARDFSAPYRAAFPDYYDIAVSYNPETVTEEEERLVYETYFYSVRDEEGEFALHLKARDRQNFSVTSKSAGYFQELYEEIQADLPVPRARGLYSFLGTAQKNFDRMVQEKELSAQSPEAMTPRDFRNYCYSTLRFCVSPNSDSSYTEPKYLLKLMALRSGREELRQVVDALPGKRKYVKSFSKAPVRLTLGDYRKRELDTAEVRAKRLKADLARLEARVEQMRNELEETPAV